MLLPVPVYTDWTRLHGLSTLGNLDRLWYSSICSVSTPNVMAMSPEAYQYYPYIPCPTNDQWPRDWQVGHIWRIHTNVHETHSTPHTHFYKQTNITKHTTHACMQPPHTHSGLLHFHAQHAHASTHNMYMHPHTLMHPSTSVHTTTPHAHLLRW